MYITYVSELNSLQASKVNRKVQEQAVQALRLVDSHNGRLRLWSAQEDGVAACGMRSWVVRMLVCGRTCRLIDVAHVLATAHGHCRAIGLVLLVRRGVFSSLKEPNPSPSRITSSRATNSGYGSKTRNERYIHEAAQTTFTVMSHCFDSIWMSFQVTSPESKYIVQFILFVLSNLYRYFRKFVKV